ncbi:MAG: MFS transporter, partial [Anoxybacillus sp.]|nr:MFS transporter [Anoxybacillus sp.]
LHIGVNTIVMNHTEEAFVGRVNGILTPLFMGAMVTTMSLAGVLKEQFSLVSIYQMSAVLFVVGIFVMLPMFRMLKQPKAKLF